MRQSFNPYFSCTSLITLALVSTTFTSLLPCQVVLSPKEKMHMIAKTMANADAIQMPTTDTLWQYLKDQGLDAIVRGTDVVEDLAEKKWHPVSIVTMIELYLLEHKKSIKESNPSQCEAIDEGKTKIIRTLLQDHPEILKKLESKGLLGL